MLLLKGTQTKGYPHKQHARHANPRQVLHVRPLKTSYQPQKDKRETTRIDSVGRHNEFGNSARIVCPARHSTASRQPSLRGFDQFQLLAGVVRAASDSFVRQVCDLLEPPAPLHGLVFGYDCCFSSTNSRLGPPVERLE